jgi:hypothetical protein
MRRFAVTVGAGALAAGLVAGQAHAADAQIYHPQLPPAGDALYAPASIISASLDILGGVNFGGGNNASGTGLSMSGVGRVNLVVHDGWNVQADVAGTAWTSYDFLGPTLNLDHTHVALTGYLYKRGPGWAFGPYVSFERRASIDEKLAFFGFGYLPRFGPWEVHAYAQVGVVTNSGASGHVLGGQVGAQYWFTNNTAVGADAMYHSFNQGGANTGVVTLAANVLHKLDRWPIALLGAVRWDSYSGAASASVASVTGGLRFYIPGPPDALSETDTGPAFTTRLSLPMNL